MSTILISADNRDTVVAAMAATGLPFPGLRATHGGGFVLDDVDGVVLAAATKAGAVVVDDHNLILAQNVIARARQIASLSVDDLVRLNLTELDYQLEDAATAVHRARGLYDDQNGYTGQLPAVVSDPADTARKIIATWTRGLITLSEMVTELQKVADVEDVKLLHAGGDIAARTDYSYLDDPAERQWLTNVPPMDVLKNAHRIYDFMAEAGLSAESMIREEAFRKASHALIIDYDVFYQAWLNEMPVGPAAIRRAKNVTA